MERKGVYMNLGDKEDDNKRIDKRERRYETPGEKEGGILKEPSGAAAYLQNAEQEYGRDRIRLAGGDPEMDQDGRTDDPDHGNQDGRLEKRDMRISPDPRIPTGGGHTEEEYFALPDDLRVELIDGVFYAMAAPAELHQLVDLDIARQLSDCIERHELEESCFLFIAPCDVALGDESNTIVQPDLYVHCGPKKGSGKKNDDLHRGAPDFVVEVLSPSNPENDLWRKRELYRRHGVREYWIVDPREETLLVFLFDKMTEQPEEDLKETGRQTHSKTDKYGKEESTIDKVQEEKYTFEEEVPVHISGGLCKVDFRRISKKIKRYWDWKKKVEPNI